MNTTVFRMLVNYSVFMQYAYITLGELTHLKVNRTIINIYMIKRYSIPYKYILKWLKPCLLCNFSKDNFKVML